jgi:hypothetical protein
MLAKGNRDDLAGLAKRDLANPTTAKEQASVGDAWWALGEKEAGASKAGLKSRARHWYEQAQPQLTGLDKARVEKRLETSIAAQSEPVPKPKGRMGLMQKGNVALKTNGARVVSNGKLFNGDSMLTGKVDPDRYASATWPCEWIIELDKTYELREIRFLLGEGGNRYYRYTMAVSDNGKTFVPVADHSQDEARMWQDIKFAPRAVKYIRIAGLFNSANADFHILQFEAYCFPPPAQK